MKYPIYIKYNWQSGTFAIWKVIDAFSAICIHSNDSDYYHSFGHKQVMDTDDMLKQYPDLKKNILSPDELFVEMI